MIDDFGDRLRNRTYSFPLSPDSEGYIDRQCPDENCKLFFKVFKADWETIPEDGNAFCPMCRKTDDENSFFTEHQLEQAKEQVIAQIKPEIVSLLDDMAEDFNRSMSSNSFISMTMSVEGDRDRPAIVPIEAQREFQLKIGCEKCKCRFAVVGSAYFCPLCGHSAAVQVFEDSIRKIEAKVLHLDRIRQVVAQLSEDDAAVTNRSILESCLQDGVVAFQRFCEELYRQHPHSKSQLPFNVFQRLEDGCNEWKQLIGKAYDDFLQNNELNRLNILFQRRHLLAHREGMVDQKYIDRSRDTSYVIGQRIVVVPNDVHDLVGALKVLAAGLKREVLNVS